MSMAKDSWSPNILQSTLDYHGSQEFESNRDSHFEHSRSIIPSSKVEQPTWSFLCYVTDSMENSHSWSSASILPPKQATQTIRSL
mmetsp:Transcript_15444/g.33721  ORF Transcript_15444/g.33721 Transcript_15444/m.33721 type:complete len:85 (+) Transcript_15444:111-365(+)